MHPTESILKRVIFITGSMSHTEANVINKYKSSAASLPCYNVLWLGKISRVTWNSQSESFLSPYQISALPNSVYVQEPNSDIERYMSALK